MLHKHTIAFVLPLVVLNLMTAAQSPQAAEAEQAQPAQVDAAADKPEHLVITQVPWHTAEGQRPVLRFKYERPASLKVETLNLTLRQGHTEYPIDTVVPDSVYEQINNTPSGTVEIPIAAEFLPGGTYEAFISPRVISAESDGVLQGEGVIFLPQNVTQGNVTIEYRFKSLGGGGMHFFFRSPDTIRNSPQSWVFYYLEFSDRKPLNIRRAENSPKGKLWDGITENARRIRLNDGQWHTMTITIDGHDYTASLDGQRTVNATDPKQLYDSGGVGIWQGPEGVIVDEIRITNEQGETVFFDDFNRDELGDDWQIASGQWQTTGSMNELQPIHIGTLENASHQPGFPTVKLEQRDDSVALMVNNERILPMILAYSTLRKMFNSAEGYAIGVRAANAKMPILSPLIGSNQYKFHEDGSLDFTQLDKTMSMLAITAPDAWLFPRLSLPAAPNIPADERIRMGHGTDMPLDATMKSVAMRRYTGVSTASTTNNAFTEKVAAQIVEHMRKQPYASRFIGAVITGSGFEGNWTPPRKPFGTMDISPAMKSLFGQWLKEKYGSAEAVAEAWGVQQVDLDNPDMPNITERTTTDAMGHKDPQLPRTRRVRDFEDFYTVHPVQYGLGPVLDQLHDAEPDLLWGFFGLFAFAGRLSPMVDHPGQDVIVGCLTYGDRKAGGVSIYTNAPWESQRMRGKLALGEADIRTVLGLQDHHHESTFHDTLQTMRREFGRALIANRMSVWYFDMNDGWFDHPLILDEFRVQAEVGEKLIELPHEDLAQMVVATPELPTRYGYGRYEEPFEPGEFPEWRKHKYMRYAGQIALETVMRVGAPKDVMLNRDLLRPDAKDYKLYVFNFQNYTSSQMRAKIHELAAVQGKTVMLFAGAGIATDESLDVKNMHELTGMTIEVGELDWLHAKIIESAHPLLAGFSAGDMLGSSQNFGRKYHVTDPDATPLARWHDGSVAVAVKPMGKGQIIYSAMPVAQSRFYRNALAFAGGHVWSPHRDAFYADNHYVVIHTPVDGAGRRDVHLPRKVAAVYDLVSGQIIATDTQRFTVTLPEKTTAMYYFGDDPQYVEGLKLGRIPVDLAPQP